MNKEMSTLMKVFYSLTYLNDLIDNKTINIGEWETLCLKEAKDRVEDDLFFESFKKED